MGKGDPPKPIIGKHVPWKAVEGHFLRVTRFIPMATVEKDKVKAFTGGPYAGLEVECLGLPVQGAYLPVVHREDFRRLWRAFEERHVAPAEELLVVYEPSKAWIVRAFQPTLHVFVYPQGSLERLQGALSTPGGGREKWDSLPRPVAEWRARY